MRWFVRAVVTAVALWVATVVIGGIDVSGSGFVKNALTLLGVAVIFGVVNATLKPLIKVVGWFVYVLTLGLFALVVNALLFLFTSWLAEQLHLPFTVDGFWAALWGALLVGVVSSLISLVVPPRSLKSAGP